MRDIERYWMALLAWGPEGYLKGRRGRIYFKQNQQHMHTVDDSSIAARAEAVTGEKDRIVTEIAQMCHWANRSWCHMNGDDSQPKWDEAPDWMKESAIKGIEFLLANPGASPEDQHEAWYQHKAAEGWKYGATKDPDKKEHPCMVAYNELPLWQQIKDSIYQGVAKGMIRKYIEVGKLSRPLTAGEEVMNVQFNPGGSGSVRRIKAAFAELHDLCIKESDGHVNLHRNREGLAEVGKPAKEGQIRRMMAVALTNIEQAQMWAVKAVTR